MSKLDTFMEEYTKQLARAVAEDALKPFDHQEYGWHDVASVPRVAEKMRRAIAANTHNHNSTGFRRTCKALGIPFTRKAIAAFIEE